MRNKLAIICACAVTGLAVAGVVNVSALQDMQDALSYLRSGELAKAQELASKAADADATLADRSTLILAAAQQRSGQFAQAQDSYRKCLESCQRADVRAYVATQIKACQDSLQPPAPLKTPSSKLTAQQLKELSQVEKDTATESSAHFTVRSRNSRLAKLVVAEAERQLDNICSSLLGGQAYAGSVEINVWLDHAEYVAHAADAPEWSGGSYSVQVDGGLTTRRVDLTQLDDKGNFAAIMIDRVLPHELCHLVVRDFFGEAACPTYLNEGLAMLAEPEADNQRILLAGAALAGKGRLPLAQLLVQRPDLKAGADQALVFYAESYSLLSFLHSRLSQQQFRDVLDHVKAGCPLQEALQRAFYADSGEGLLASTEAAWTQQAIEQAQDLRMLNTATASRLP